MFMLVLKCIHCPNEIIRAVSSFVPNVNIYNKEWLFIIIIYETGPTPFFIQIYYICVAKKGSIQNKKYSFIIYLPVQYKGRDCSKSWRSTECFVLVIHKNYLNDWGSPNSYRTTHKCNISKFVNFYGLQEWIVQSKIYWSCKMTKYDCFRQIQIYIIFVDVV